MRLPHRSILLQKALPIFVILGLASSLENSRGYVLEGPSWPQSTVIVQSGLGNAGRTLSDGNTSWDAAVAPAFGIWNQSILRTQLSGVINPSAPVSSGDGVNVLVFSDTIFGQAFGSSTLAVTYYRYSGSNMTEADILVNNHWSWDSYRGPLSSPTDIRRVVIHELGHVLGLDHPDQHGQVVDAIMNSTVSNRETTSADDISGVQSIYSAAQGTPTPTPTPVSSLAISVSASPTTVPQGGSSSFILTASRPTDVPVTVSYSMSGKAVYGRYYTLSGTFGQATIFPGNTTTTVTLTALTNSFRRGRKTATMTLSPGANYSLSSARSTSVTIVKSNARGTGEEDADPEHEEVHEAADRSESFEFR